MSIYIDSLIPVKIKFKEKRNLDNIRRFLLTQKIDENLYRKHWLKINEKNIWKKYWEFVNEKYLIKDGLDSILDLKEKTNITDNILILDVSENNLLESVLIIEKLWNVDFAIFIWINQCIIEDRLRWLDPDINVAIVNFDFLFDANNKIISENHKINLKNTSELFKI